MTESKKNAATAESADKTAKNMTAQSVLATSSGEKSSASEPSAAKSAASNTTATPPASGRPTAKGVNTVLAFSVLLLIVLATGAGLYYWQRQQLAVQRNISAQLTSQLAQLRGQQQQLQTNLTTLNTQWQQNNNSSQQHTAALLQQLTELQEKVAGISAAEANNWMLAQADFLVNMAARKLWADQDTRTAVALLKSADTSLADMRDPSLITARQAIHADIANISAINQVDYDGIILEMSQLANQVDNLRLADDPRQQITAESELSLSSSLHEWRQNLAKSWHRFLDSFISIRRRDISAQPLLAPDQEIYLRENLRARLLIAVQAVPRHQQSTYQQSLEDIASWVRAYYNTDDATTKTFLNSIDKLSQQHINMTLPESLQSQPILQRLVQSRLRDIPAQSTEKAVTPNDAASPDEQSTPNTDSTPDTSTASTTGITLNSPEQGAH